MISKRVFIHGTLIMAIFIYVSLHCEQKRPKVTKLRRVKYSFTRPKAEKYSGPIASGWPPTRSRNASDYFNENSIVSNLDCFKRRKFKALILIQSAPENILRRNAIRSTWMKNFGDDFKTIFVFGKNPSNESLESFCDYVQFDFIDSYANVTLDSIAALTLAVEEFEADFVAIGDDDLFINVKNFKQLIQSMQGTSFI